MVLCVIPCILYRNYQNINVPFEGAFSLITTSTTLSHLHYIIPKIIDNQSKFGKILMVSWTKSEKHPFKVSTLEICLWLLLALRMLILNCSALHDKRNSSIGFYGFLGRIPSSRPIQTASFCRSRIFQVILNTFKSCSEIFCFWGFLWQLMQIWKMAKYKTKEFHLDTQDENISNF